LDHVSRHPKCYRATYRRAIHDGASAVMEKALVSVQTKQDEFCAVTKQHRKHLIRLLNGPAPGAPRPRGARDMQYAPDTHPSVTSVTPGALALAQAIIPSKAGCPLAWTSPGVGWPRDATRRSRSPDPSAPPARTGRPSARAGGAPARRAALEGPRPDLQVQQAAAGPRVSVDRPVAGSGARRRAVDRPDSLPRAPRGDVAGIMPSTGLCRVSMSAPSRRAGV